MSELMIGVAQLESRTGSATYDPRPDNLASITDAATRLKSMGAQLAVFGEAFLNGYETGPYAYRYALAPDPPDEWVAKLEELAKCLELVIIVGATTTRGPNPGSLFNSALLFDPQHGLAGIYSKTHIPNVGVGEGVVVSEGAIWAAGDEIVTFETALGVIGVEICFDVFYPEVARTHTLNGADLIVNISAAVRDEANEALWDHMLFARAVENAVPYLHVSVVGRQGQFEYFGGSRLLGADGIQLGALPRYEPSLGVFALDMTGASRRRAQYQTLTSRRPSLYRMA